MASLRELPRKTLERPHEPIDEEDAQVRCGDCGRMEGEIHMAGCDMERCPWCGGQLISCGCPHRVLRLRGDKTLTGRQAERFAGLLEAKGRVPYVRWPLLCARCGGKQPTLYRSEVGAGDWDRYVQMDVRDAWLCDPCYARIKKVVDERSNLGGL